MRVRQAAFLACFVILLPLFLFGCDRDASAADELEALDTPSDSTTAAIELQPSSTTLSTRELESTTESTSTLAAATTSIAAVIPRLSASVDFLVSEPDAFLADAQAKSAITTGIARAHEVSDSYVDAIFSKGRRLVATSLRRLNGAIHVDYTISVPETIDNLAQELIRVVTVAETMTLATMHLTLKEAIEEVATQHPDNAVLQQIESVFNVTEFAEPQTISVSSSTGSTTTASIGTTTSLGSTSTMTTTGETATGTSVTPTTSSTPLASSATTTTVVATATATTIVAATMAAASTTTMAVTTMAAATTAAATTTLAVATTATSLTIAAATTTIMTSAVPTTMPTETTLATTATTGASTTATSTQTAATVTASSSAVSATATTTSAVTSTSPPTSISTTSSVVTVSTTIASTAATTSTSSTTTTTLSQEMLSQFLIQATFGPTRASLEDISSKSSLKDWISDQMALPAELHRAYYRAGVNPHVTANVRPGNPRGKCKKGSRWHQIAFTQKDIGRAVSISNNEVFIDGSLRTEIDASGGDGNGDFAYWAGSNAFLNTGGFNKSSYVCTALTPNSWSASSTCATKSFSSCSLSQWFTESNFCEKRCYDKGMGHSPCGPAWQGYSFTGYICKVEETVGGPVTMDINSNCNNAETTMDNIRIWFSSVAARPTLIEDVSSGSDVFYDLPTGAIAFNGIDLRRTSFLLGADAPGCSFKDFIYVNSSIGYLRHASRLELIENTLATPGEAVENSLECPTVIRSFVNEQTCVKKTTCLPLSLRHSVFTLDSTSLAAFYTIDNKYLYEITGLRNEASPCNTVSRWKLLNCSQVTCTTTNIPAGDLTPIANALSLQNTWIRDISVACDANNVPQDAIVDVSGDIFQHISLHEHNVYDFTDWVAAHPGGQSQITQWASHNHTIHFPSNHPMDRWLAGTTQNELQYIGLIGDRIDFSTLPTGLQSSTMSTHFAGTLFTDQSYFQSCGSPGETANVPEQGNRFLFWYTYVDSNDKHYDGVLDNPYWEDFSKSSYTNDAKMMVWAAVVWKAQDQLRQRMAWAFSQILVTSAPGYGYNYMMEFWHNYYDIFVRHAFGNYRDILKEVTYSPVMGDYLTYKGSKSYDYKKFYPDENYAREVMQLFTIGLWKLNSNGSLAVDDNGYEVPTYDNTQITSFARIFTGFDEQLPRANMEALKGEKNNIDPMRIDPIYRDTYPKSDLYNGFIGDGYPLCSDLLPRAFLEQGRKFIFIGYVYSGHNVAILDQGSSLYKELCGHTDPCDFNLTVTLPNTLACHQKECLMDTVYIVKVANGYFEYDPPACVNMYFYNGRMAKELARYNHDWYGACRNPDTQVAATSCCGTVNGTYAEKHICGYPEERVRYAVAEANCAAAGAGYEVCNSMTSITTSCDFADTVVWKTDACQVDIIIDGVGSVNSQYNTYSKWNTWPVFWENTQYPKHDPANNITCPSGCSTTGDNCMCTTTVVASAVFSSVPTKAELKAACFIGAFTPTISCTHNCDGDVKAYAGSGSIDDATIFECEGRYYRNLKSMVEVPGGYSFRNPPSFIVARNEIEKGHGVAPFPTLRSCEWEVDALLDQLIYHDNTAPFVCYRLIQRFGNSNPSATYISAVVDAFRTGGYDGTTYSGVYGDLSATVAAILLHPEARNPTNPTDGSLREPIVKFVHAMRALEYEEDFGRDIYLDQMDERIGQNFGEQPTVFNFYLPAYQPPSFTGATVAPEFQLFTPPLAVGWLNGMMSFAQHGLTECDEGFGIASSWFCGTTYSTYYANRFGPGGGKFNLPEGATLNETVDKLDLLLTGGRVTNKATIMTLLQGFAIDKQYEMARKAILMLPEFHTIGMNTVLGTRPIVIPPVINTPPDYKALVVLFMNGGADTFNLVIPNEGTLLTEYSDIRGDIALQNFQINPITIPSGQAITNWGIHFKLPYLQTLFNEGSLAFITNIGAMVEPMTKEQFRYGGSQKCVGLFSHQDQQTAAYTLKCQTAGTGPKGNGGRISDALSSRSIRAESFSITGTSAWSQGITTDQQIVDKNDGAVRLQDYATLNPLLQAINDQQYQNVYCNEYAQAISAFVESSEDLGQILDAATGDVTTTFSKSTSLSKQFYQVARLISARTARKAERDFFFTSIGGFDAHSNAAEVLEELFLEINDATQELVTELKAQSVFDNVVIASQSDFGRSLTTNGAGTDHAWAGQYWAIGGKIQGGKMYNDFPTSLAADNEMDAGRGRQIPKYPWENMMVPISQWMGVQSGELTSVFPNINNFDSNLILPECTLFDCTSR